MVVENTSPGWIVIRGRDKITVRAAKPKPKQSPKQGPIQHMRLYAALRSLSPQLFDPSLILPITSRHKQHWE